MNNPVVGIVNATLFSIPLWGIIYFGVSIFI
ncbi:hypothetical protein EDD58_101627 [Hazenella coriacea]|uniref:Uncharacterized protein n=1 Tax=Hazenella coriacea TaxID=1179467 RepID=A0A4R3LCG9_9BACL|nr:hypothetical protein EDD58_101627 [Hazenella coriacea]